MIKNCERECLIVEIILGLILAISLFIGGVVIISYLFTVMYKKINMHTTTIRVLEMAADKKNETRLTKISISEVKSHDSVTETPLELREVI